MRADLSTQSIDRAVSEAEEYLNQKNIDQKGLLRIRMGIEEVLLFYRKAFGEEATFFMDKGKSLGRKKIRITVPGNMANPFTSPELTSEEDRFMQMALENMGQLPKWSYSHGANRIVFVPKKIRIPEWQSLLIAIFSAVILGVIVRFLPADINAILLDKIISPLLNTFLGFLNAVAGPMIFLSVVWGIYSVGDTATFSVMGKKLGSSYMKFLCTLVIVLMGVCLPLCGITSGGFQGGEGLESLYKMVLDIVPSNLFTPFSRGNTLQILFEAIIIGIAMLLVGKETRAVADLSEQLGNIVNGIMGVISMMVPFFVFGSLFTLTAQSNLAALMEGVVFFGATVLGCVFCMLLHTAAACVRLKISPTELWKKTASTTVISITTASSAAAFSDNINTCINKLGVSKMLANFGVPFGQILYKPGVAALYWFAAVSVATGSGVQISIAWIVMAVIICVILSMAVPPVPGGMSASFAILFLQLGLPAEKIAVVLTLTAILDFVVTATDLFSGQCILAIVSREIDS